MLIIWNTQKKSCTFRFLRILYPNNQRSWTSLHSHSVESSLSLHYVQHLNSFILLNFAILTGVRWNISVVLNCIFLNTWNSEHFSDNFKAFFLFLLLGTACLDPSPFSGQVFFSLFMISFHYLDIILLHMYS